MVGPSIKKKPANAGHFNATRGLRRSGLGQLRIVCDQGDQRVLLTVGQLAETLQQLALVQAEFRAVQANTEIVLQRPSWSRLCSSRAMISEFMLR